MIAVLNDRLLSSESHLASAGSALEVARASAARAEERVSASGSEIRKGNQIIERLQAELRSAKDRLPGSASRPMKSPCRPSRILASSPGLSRA